jgi:4-carboxymuconolactone decarboxylase
MARIRGVEPEEAGWFVRLAYWFTRRKLKQITGKESLPEAVKILAHHRRLLRATAQMELGQEAARTLPRPLKSLASVKAALLVGCPY